MCFESRLLKRHLGKTAQSAAVLPGRAGLAQKLERRDADLQVLVDPFAVEMLGHAR